MLFSNGIKPTGLNAGNWNEPPRAGDCLRVHFDPPRLVDANARDWGAADGVTKGNGERPGVMAVRDNGAGYAIIDKPPNAPVPARVDNSLENVASCVRRMTKNFNDGGRRVGWLYWAVILREK